jgi:hypothetical protein
MQVVVVGRPHGLDRMAANVGLGVVDERARWVRSRSRRVGGDGDSVNGFGDEAAAEGGAWVESLLIVRRLLWGWSDEMGGWVEVVAVWA